MSDVLRKMKTPKEFAERYLQREIFKPFIANVSSLLFLRDRPIIYGIEKIYKKSFQDKWLASQKISITTLEKGTISKETKESIYVALHEFTKALHVDLELLKKLNKEIVKKKKEMLLN